MKITLAIKVLLVTFYCFASAVHAQDTNRSETSEKPNVLQKSTAVLSPQDFEKLKTKGYVSTFFEILENLKSRKVAGGRRSNDFSGPIGIIAPTLTPSQFCNMLSSCDWEITLSNGSESYDAVSFNSFSQTLASSPTDTVSANLVITAKNLKFENSIDLLAGEALREFRDEEGEIIGMKLSAPTESILLIDLYEKYGLFFQAEKVEEQAINLQ